MARPNKIGLDYFPLDVELSEEIKIIDAKFGLQGFGIIIKLWQIVYDNGYYIKWTERELLLYKNRINADINLINDVIKECVKWGLFDENLYNNGILSSRGIQKRYLIACERRKSITIDKSIWITDLPEDNYSPEVVYVDNNLINVDSNSINTNRSTQSKVKESKVKESKEKVYRYGTQKNVKLTEDELQRLRDEHPEDADDAIEFLSLWIAEKGDKSKAKTHNLTIRRWVIEAVQERKQKKSFNNSNNKELSYSERIMNL